MADENDEKIIPFFQWDKPKLFPSSHVVHAELINGRHMVTLTGVAIISFKGESQKRWRERTISLGLNFPHHFLPPGQWFYIENSAPFVTINAIYNDREALHAGWAVDEFRLAPGSQRCRDGVYLMATVAVRDSDGILWRVGYSLTVTGVPANPPSGPG